MNTRSLLTILLLQIGLLSSVFAQEGQMEWVLLTDEIAAQNDVDNSKFDADVTCYGLLYTPKLSGVLTSYVTGFLVNCSSSDNMIVSSKSFVMNDKSEVTEDCSNSGFIMITCSGNAGSYDENKVTEGEGVIIHHVCFDVPAGEFISVVEDEITDLTTNIDAFNRTTYMNSVTDFPELIDLEIGFTITDVNEEVAIENDQLDIYPNPARTEIELTTEPKSEEVLIRILDTRGQMVYQKNFKAGTWMEKQKLDVSQFADGLFLIEITDTDSKATGRFIKVK